MLINFTELVKKYEIEPCSLLHVGASTGQELPEYIKNGFDTIYFVEAIKDVYDKLVANTAPYLNVTCINACISDVDGQDVEFNISSNDGESSSMFEFGTHSEIHPDVTFVDKIKMRTTTLKTIIEERGINFEDGSFLNCDLQGAELLALKGLGEYLHKFKYLYLEVNFNELYKGCALVGEIDEYVKGFGFERVETCDDAGRGWTDAIYIKK